MSLGFIARVVASDEEDGGGLHLVLLLNSVLGDLLLKHGLRNIIQQGAVNTEKQLFQEFIYFLASRDSTPGPSHASASQTLGF